MRVGLLSVNPSDKADPPSAKAAASPEMRFWSASELRSFLDQCAAAQDELVIALTLLAATGLRRGEALALRWSDIDFDAARLSVRRSVGVVKHKGQGEEIVLGLHDLRHTHATLLLAAGVPVKVVSERLGHASATITLGIYAHVMPGMQAQAAAKVGALMAGGAS